MNSKSYLAFYLETVAKKRTDEESIRTFGQMNKHIAFLQRRAATGCVGMTPDDFRLLLHVVFDVPDHVQRQSYPFELACQIRDAIPREIEDEFSSLIVNQAINHIAVCQSDIDEAIEEDEVISTHDPTKAVQALEAYIDSANLTKQELIRAMCKFANQYSKNAMLLLAERLN